jgi:hypothetical protein
MKTIALTAAFSIASTLGALRGVQVPEEPFATDVPAAVRVLLAGGAQFRTVATMLPS